MESTRFLQLCENVQRISGGKFDIRTAMLQNVPVIVVHCGMGPKLAAAAAHTLLDGHTVSWLISTGFGGSLDPVLNVGDLVVATDVADEAGQSLHIDMQFPADPAAGQHVGKLLTCDRIIRTAAEKRTLHEKTQAVVVDMETVAVAAVCRDRKQRFLAIRVISDSATVDLPPEILSIVGATGSVRMGALVGSLFRRPSAAVDLWKLRGVAQQCAERLGNFLAGVVGRLAEFG